MAANLVVGSKLPARLESFLTNQHAQPLDQCLVVPSTGTPTKRGNVILQALSITVHPAKRSAHPMEPVRVGIAPSGLSLSFSGVDLAAHPRAVGAQALHQQLGFGQVIR
jgi:hypothetical protein